MPFVLSLLLAATPPILVVPAPAGQDAAVRDPLLDLYAETYAEGILAFGAVPAAYRGGPAAPEYVRMKKQLNAQRDRARAILVTRFGAAAITQIENDADEQLGRVYFISLPAASEAARKKYPALLRKLKRGVDQLK